MQRLNEDGIEELGAVEARATSGGSVEASVVGTYDENGNLIATCTGPLIEIKVPGGTIRF
jgi:hypothetical protein